ncbi:MAG: ABC transporter ATP-binding protein [Parvibaculaceae bacterium]
MSGTILSVRGVSKKFYGVAALDDVDISVRENEIVGLIGPNGSGKSTLFNCITGIHPVDGGSVEFDGRDITNARPHEISLRGLTRSFQMVQIYPGLTVVENLLIALQEHQERSFVGRIMRSRQARRKEAEAHERAEFALGEFGLSDVRDLQAGILSYGQRKLVEFAAVLMPDPKLILLDEPAAAINPSMINQMKLHIRKFKAMGKTIMLVEHNMNLVMDICDTICVLDQGRKLLEGDPRTVRQDERVMEAYFGK